MAEFWDNSRGVYVGMVSRANKPNSVVDKGEPYVWAKSGKYSPKKLFKNMEELDKVFPREFTITSISLKKLLNKFKKTLLKNNKLTVEEFFKEQNIIL